MKTTLDHLPKDKQEQLAQVVQIIVESVSPEKIILFGSYARGKWVDEQHMEGNTLHEYTSDYDILVITVRGDDRHEYDLQDKIEARCHFRTPVTVIVHSIDFVNARLAEGQYFFSDIKKEGILLYDAGNIPLADLKELSTKERHDIAKEDFEHWFTTAEKFLKGANLYYKERDFNMAAFMLHQAAERTYSAVILVFAGYRPRTHNLGKLMRLCRDFAPDLSNVFQTNDNKENALFTILKKAYIDARYKKNYQITEEEVAILIEKVKLLQIITERICKEKIASLDAMI